MCLITEVSRGKSTTKETKFFPLLLRFLRFFVVDFHCFRVSLTLICSTPQILILRDKELLKRSVDHLQLAVFTAVPLVDLQAAHEADPVRPGEFRPMLDGVPPQGFDLGLLSTDQKFQVFLFERLDRAQRQSPHQEERLRIAYAGVFPPGTRSGQINSPVLS